MEDQSIKGNKFQQALKGLCHQILYLFWRSNKLNKYFL
jgi:hypothetical protein